jgi:hypothetical protein
MSSAYLTTAEFKTYTVMPAVDVDALEAAAPNWLANQLLSASVHLDARLRKRYAVPFAAPVPEIVKMWVTRVVTLRAYLRRGVDASDLQFAEIKADADTAVAEVKEAADAAAGLFDLPLRADSTASAITAPSPLAYSESSPYTWTDVQAEGGR